MTTATHSHSADLMRQGSRGAYRVAKPATARAGNATGLGGKSVARIVMEHCERRVMPLGVIVEYLNTQIGTWQYSLDEGESWRTIRTDIINRPGHTGLALEPTAWLRVLPLGGGLRSAVARMVLHATQRAPIEGSGSYQTYATDDRDDAACSVTLTLTLGAINGIPPAVPSTRPRNKRALAAQRSTA